MMDQERQLEFVPGTPRLEGSLQVRVDRIELNGACIGTRTEITPPGDRECRQIHIELPAIGYQRDLSRLTLGRELESEAVREVEAVMPQLLRGA